MRRVGETVWDVKWQLTLYKRQRQAGDRSYLWNNPHPSPRLGTCLEWTIKIRTDPCEGRYNDQHCKLHNLKWKWKFSQYNQSIGVQMLLLKILRNWKIKVAIEPGTEMYRKINNGLWNNPNIPIEFWEDRWHWVISNTSPNYLQPRPQFRQGGPFLDIKNIQQN